MVEAQADFLNLKARQRGSMLLEAAIAISVTVALMGYIAQTTGDEADRQKSVMIATEHDVIMSAARNFMQQSYNDVIRDLYAAGGEVSYTTDDIIAAGFLPASYNGGVLRATYGKEYALLARAVDRADTAEPQATLGPSDMDPLATGEIVSYLVDGDPSNGEMEIEAILVTHGGDSIPLGMGGEILGRMSVAYGGLVSDAGKASGAFANFEMDISEFATLAEYPSVGDMAGLVALSSYGVLTGAGEAEQVPDPFRRCDGVNIASDEYSDCLASNEIYADLVLRPYDTDGDGTNDRLPALRNVAMLDCAETGGTGTINEFTIDCATTNLTGDLVVAGENAKIGNLDITADTVSFDGEEVLARKDINGTTESVLNADRLTLQGVNGGHDMSEALFHTEVVAAGETIDQPICPDTTIDGAQIMEPRVYMSPAAYSDPSGRPILGVRAFPEDLGTQWRARILLYVGEDNCTNDASSPISIADDASICEGASMGSDGKADVYELVRAGGVDYGAVIASTRCY